MQQLQHEAGRQQNEERKRFLHCRLREIWAAICTAVLCVVLQVYFVIVMGIWWVFIEDLACPASNLQMDYIPLKLCEGFCKIKGEKRRIEKRDGLWLVCKTVKERKVRRWGMVTHTGGDRQTDRQKWTRTDTRIRIRIRTHLWWPGPFTYCIPALQYSLLIVTKAGLCGLSGRDLWYGSSCNTNS